MTDEKREMPEEPTRFSYGNEQEWRAYATTLRTMLLAARETIAQQGATLASLRIVIKIRDETLAAEKEKSAGLDSALKHATMIVEMGAAKRRGLAAQLAEAEWRAAREQHDRIAAERERAEMAERGGPALSRRG